MAACTARRGTLPLSLSSGGAIGSPTTRCTFTGLMNLAPLPIARSVPPIPTGTIGTCTFAAA